MKDFSTDVEMIQSRVRREMGRPVREGRERERVVFLLNEALALNIACVLRHMGHFINADRFKERSVVQTFLMHTVRESEHSDMIVERINQLNGSRTFQRNSMSRRRFVCDSSSAFAEIIREDIVAELRAADTYRAMIEWLQGIDSTSSQILQQILTLEEEHIDVMLSFASAVID